MVPVETPQSWKGDAMKKVLFASAVVLTTVAPLWSKTPPAQSSSSATVEKIGDYLAERGTAATRPGQSSTDRAIADLSGKGGPRPLSEKIRAKLADSLHDKVSNAVKNYNEFKPLAPSDKELGIDRPRPGPKVPSKCAETQGCAQCFVEAQGDVEHLRFALERLRAIGVWTDKFTKKQIAFGDDVSSVHGVAGIAWHAERDKIEKSYESFGEIYDAKHEELIDDLEGALQAVGECEAQYFGTDDWYDRFGYLYYTFAVDFYKRPS